MSIKLDNLNVLLTRPERQSAALAKMIIAAGGNAILFPTVAFAPPADRSLFKESIKSLGEQNWIIFISPQSVYVSVPDIRRAWPVFPSHVKFAAVGKGTMLALRDAGYNAEAYPTVHAGSDGFLNLPEFQNCRGLKIAIVRGMGGRELIDKELALRGAKVLSIIAYQGVLAQTDNTAVLELLKQHKIQVIISTSFDIVNNLKILTGETHWELLKKIPLIVVSMRIKKLANDLGFETIWVTREMSDTAILHLLEEKRSVL